MSEEVLTRYVLSAAALVTAGVSGCNRPATAPPAPHAVTAAAPAARPPAAPERPVVDHYFGQSITDPYRWMEDTRATEFVSWTRAQDAFTRSAIGKIHGRKWMIDRLREVSRGVGIVRDVAIAGTDYFFLERPADRNTFRLSRRAHQGGPTRVLVDLESQANANVDYFAPSPDGRFVAYGISAGGTENSVLHVLDSETGREIIPPIERARYANVSWLPAGDGFLYTSQPELPANAPAGESYKNNRVHLHRLGATGPNPAVFGSQLDSSPFVDANETPRVLVSATSELAVGVTDHGVGDAMQLAVKRRADLLDAKRPWKVVVPKSDGVVSFALHGSDIFAITYNGASRHQLVRYALKDGVATIDKTVVLPEGKVVLQRVEAASNGLYILALDGGASRLFALSFRGGEPREIALPPDATVNSLSTSPTESGCAVRVETWTTSPQWLACDGSTAHCRDTALTAPSPVNFSDIRVEHLVAKSRDGTLVPLTVLRAGRAPRNGANPTMLYGYGAYGIPLKPNFQEVRRAWFDAGGVIAFAHVRGGGEFGRAWQEGGARQNKGRSFEDFIACAEALIEANVTSSSQLSAYGGSAGGILVSGAVVRRPELFRAAFVEVGDVNMLRIEQYPDAAQSIEEFGSTATLEGFRGLLQMDAFHHVTSGTAYPAMLFSTGMNDPRVPSWSSAKMAARMQAATSSGRPVLLRADFDGGHGVGSTKEQLLELRADFYSFLLWQLGHPDFQTELAPAVARAR